MTIIISSHQILLEWPNQKIAVRPFYYKCRFNFGPKSDRYCEWCVGLIIHMGIQYIRVHGARASHLWLVAGPTHSFLLTVWFYLSLINFLILILIWLNIKLYTKMLMGPAQLIRPDCTNQDINWSLIRAWGPSP